MYVNIVLYLNFKYNKEVCKKKKIEKSFLNYPQVIIL